MSPFTCRFPELDGSLFKIFIGSPVLVKGKQNLPVGLNVIVHTGLMFRTNFAGNYSKLDGNAVEVSLGEVEFSIQGLLTAFQETMKRLQASESSRRRHKKMKFKMAMLRMTWRKKMGSSSHFTS